MACTGVVSDIFSREGDGANGVRGRLSIQGGQTRLKQEGLPLPPFETAPGSSIYRAIGMLTNLLIKPY